MAEVEVERLGTNGRGVGRLDSGMAVFVEDGLPGQRVRARLHKVKKSFAEARIEEVLEESPHRTEPRCVHFFTCGGCRLQHLDYAAQLRAKTAQVTDALERIGHFDDPPVRDALDSPDAWGYRNKMEYSFGDVRWLTKEEMGAEEGNVQRDFALGLHPRGRWAQILHLQECHLPHPRSVEILKAVQDRTAGSRFAPYSGKTHRGYWRFLITRQGVRTDQWLADIVTEDLPDAHGETEALARGLEEIGGNRYCLDLVQPIDLLPHTPHVECVARLTA
ncbi:MAG: TRAM domain-containing protein [bacterium]